MGLESYNLKVKTNNHFSNEQIKSCFISMNYSQLKDMILEKCLDSGFIEVSIENDNIWIRTARANDNKIITNIFNDFKHLNSIMKITIYDLQTKENVSIKDFKKTERRFIELRKEFYEYFPTVKHPIRCNDVFKQLE